MSTATTTTDESLRVLAKYAQDEYSAINTAYQSGAQAIQKNLMTEIEGSEAKPTTPDENWP